MLIYYLHISGGTITFIIGPFTMSHLWLILMNRTTIENSQFQKWKKERRSGNTRLIPGFTENGHNVFDQGYKENWVEVMGSDRLLWFCKVTRNAFFFRANSATSSTTHVETRY